MMTIHVTTQYMENYGSPDAPYWKGKGGDIIVLTGVPAGADPATVVDTMRSQLEYRNDMSEQYVLGWSVESDDALTADEQDQMRFDGRIDYPSQRLPVTV